MLSLPTPPLLPHLSRWLERLFRTVAWMLLAVGLLLGLAWGALHVWIVPRIEDFRPTLENLARQQLGLSVQIGQLRAESTGWVPSLELRDIQILDANQQPALRLPRVVVAISLHSVLQLHLDQLVLDRPILDVRRLPDGQWEVGGLRIQPDKLQDSPLADWLLSQRELVVRGGRLRWLDAQSSGPERLEFEDLDLILRNGARAHLLRLDATPVGGLGERMVLMGNFRRSLLSTHAGRLREWTGQWYVHSPSADLGRWGPHVSNWVHALKGHGALRLWLDMAQGRITQLSADLDLKALSVAWDAHSEPLGFDALSGRISGRQLSPGFALDTRDLRFVSDSGLQWPGGQVSLRYVPAQGSKAAKGEFSGQQLELPAVRELALRLPWTATLRASLEPLQVQGLVSSVQAHWTGPIEQPLDYDAQASVQDLAWSWASAASARGPSLSGAHVEWRMTQQGGQVRLEVPRGGELQLPGWLDEPVIPLRDLKADARWSWNQGRLEIPQWSLNLSNADLQGQFKGKWQASADGQGPGLLDLQGQIPQVAAPRVVRYLPKFLSATVRQYVSEAITRGTVQGVQIRLRGDLREMPFTDPRRGEFRIAGHLREVDMNYVPDSLLPRGSAPWPMLTGLQGDLVFERQSMKLQNGSARAVDARSGLQISGLQAQIPDLAHDAQLQVSADLRGTLGQMLSVVQKSPLDRLLGGVLSDSRGGGSAQARLQLMIPVLHSADTRVNGQLVLAGNELSLDPGVPALERLQGTLQFNESGFSLQGVQARALGGAVRIEGGLRGRDLQIRLQGQATSEGLQQAQGLSPVDTLSTWLQGSTSYQAQLGWAEGQVQVAVQSSLEGMEVKLPAPLGKRAAQSLPLSFERRGLPGSRGERDQLQLRVGQVASVQYVRDLSAGSPQVLRGMLALGRQSVPLPPLPDSGVSAQIGLDQIPLDAWMALWPADRGIGLVRGEGLAYVPSRLRLTTASLSTEGRTLHDVSGTVSRDGTLWRGQVEARELSGQFEYRQGQGDQPGRLFARLPRLSLPPSTVSEFEAVLETAPTSLPALDIVVDQFELRGKSMGRLEIEASNRELARVRPSTGPVAAPREWQLSKFNLTVPEASFKGQGRWVAAADGSSQRRTEIKFVLDVGNGGALLNRLGTPEALRGTAGKMEGQIQWAGSPLSLHYPSLSGQFRMEMGRGQFLKADPGAAKLLGVLSLQALPRRLLLDFSDVFREGFLFDSAQGDVSIERGIASTRNLQIKGVTALVRMEGQVDIAQETQHLQVLVLPALDAGTAALVAGIAVNPVVGLTSFLAQLFLQKPLAKASSQVFMIDGSWTDPKVSKVDPASLPAQTPPGKSP